MSILLLTMALIALYVQHHLIYPKFSEKQKKTIKNVMSQKEKTTENFDISTVVNGTIVHIHYIHTVIDN